MWTKTISQTTKLATKEQIWKLFADVNNWNKWDDGIEYAQMEGDFIAGNHFILKPKDGPKVKIKLIETVKNRKFVDLTVFPLAKMTGTHIFEETPDGLKMTTTMQVTGLLSALWVKLVASKIVAHLPEEMQHQAEYASKL